MGLPYNTIDYGNNATLVVMQRSCHNQSCYVVYWTDWRVKVPWWLCCPNLSWSWSWNCSLVNNAVEHATYSFLNLSDTAYRVELLLNQKGRPLMAFRIRAYLTVLHTPGSDEILFGAFCSYLAQHQQSWLPGPALCLLFVVPLVLHCTLYFTISGNRWYSYLSDQAEFRAHNC